MKKIEGFKIGKTENGQDLRIIGTHKLNKDSDLEQYVVWPEVFRSKQGALDWIDINRWFCVKAVNAREGAMFTIEGTDIAYIKNGNEVIRYYGGMNNEIL